MGKVLGAVLSVAILVLLVLPLLMLPLAWALVADIAIIAMVIMVDASRNRLLMSMAIRNMVRHRSLTVLVVAGLMVGTAIISAALVTGDTLDNMITVEVTQGFGEVDFEIMPFEGAETTSLPRDQLQSVAHEIDSVDHVESVAILVREWVTAFNNNESLFTPNGRLIGMDMEDVNAFGGLMFINGTAVTDLPAGNAVLINQRLADRLDVEVGNVLSIYSGPNATVMIVAGIVKDEGMGANGGSTNIYTSTAQAQAVMDEGDMLNMIWASIEGQGSHGLAYADDVRDDILVLLNDSSLDLEITGDKQQVLESNQQNIATITDLMLVFGSFAIISGIALIVNIFAMLAEERKSEMGMARAVGMTRSRLRKLYIYEGLVYALVAAGVGTLVGLGIAYVLVIAIGSLFGFGIDPTSFFTFRNESLAISYLAGFILTLAIVYGATSRITKLNVVRAIRNIPEPVPRRDDQRTFRTGLMAIAFGLVLMMIGIALEVTAPAISGLSIATLSMGLVLRRYISERAAWNVAALLTLVQWIPGVDLFPYYADIEMFIISGVFTVVCGLLLIMANSDLIIRFSTVLFGRRRGSRAVLRTAFSYPLKAKFKTALSIFIFALIIFTITVLSIMTAMVSADIEQTVVETSGGLDVLAFTGIPISDSDFEAVISAPSAHCQAENMTKSVSLSAAGTVMNASDGQGNFTERGYNVMGYDSAFFTEADYELAAWDEGNFSSSEAVYQRVLVDPGYVILDGAFLNQGQIYVPITPGGVRVDPGTSIAIQTPTGWRNVTVAGVMEQSILNGVFMGKQAVADMFDVEDDTVFLIEFADGLDIDEQAKLLERDFLPWRMQTLSIETLAEEIVSSVESIFTLFRAFIAIGLIIGLTGLGIITIRSIHERRVEIGMMRAIGFTKRMVVRNFSYESLFIALLGVLVGVLTGIMVGYIIYLEGFQQGGVGFLIPWWELLLLSVGVLVATLLSILPASRGASKVAPAEVLRFE